VVDRVVKYLGAAYLIYLNIRNIRTRHVRMDESAVSSALADLTVASFGWLISDKLRHSASAKTTAHRVRRGNGPASPAPRLINSGAIEVLSEDDPIAKRCQHYPPHP